MRFHWLLVLAVMMLHSLASAEPLLNSGSLAIKLLVSAQGLDNATVISKTNSTRTSTTVTTVSKSTVSNVVIHTADILELLENSFNTTFSSGSQLMVSRTGDFFRLSVTDSSGTNVVLNLSSNLFIGTMLGEQPIRTALQTEVAKTTGSGGSVSASDTETVTETVILGYDDTGLTTKDGTHMHFQVTCLLVRKSSENLVNQQFKDVIKLQGVGYGTIHDQNVILQGSASAKVSGVLFVP